MFNAAKKIFFQDLNRLAILLDTHLVFYVEINKTTFYVWRNYKNNFAASGCRYFLFAKTDQRKMSLRESSVNLDYKCSPFFALPNQNLNLQPPVSFLHSILACCSLDPELSAHLTVDTLNELSTLSTQMYNIYGKKIVIVEFKGVKGKHPAHSRARRAFFESPGKCVFQILAIFASQSELQSLAALNPKTIDHVVCCYSENLFCLLSPTYATCITDMLLEGSAADVTRDKVATLEVGAGGPNLFGQDKLEEKQKKNAKIQNRKSKWRGDKIKKICKCPSCGGSTLYDDNMSRGGPEKLLTHKLILSELVKMLGAKSDDTDAILEQLSRLSLAAFDIESTTAPLDHLSDADSQMPLGEIDIASRGQQALAVQKPIMLAHRDALMHSNEDCTVFTLESEGETGVYNLVKTYWKYVVHRRNRLKLAKQNLAQPLLELCEKYQQAYFEYAQNWRDPNIPNEKLEFKKVVSGWRHSIPGKLQSQIIRLINNFEIFSFYGSGYDHVLLQAYLVPYLFERKLRPQLEKTGNKIIAIKVKKLGINFRDVVKLLSPGTSLRQFGQLFKLTQEKAHFPFSMLTGLSALAIPELPASLSDWNNSLSLSKESLTQSDVDESIKLFKQNNCQCLGDYLKIYLKLDVDILFSATQGLRQMIAKEIGVDFVQSGNFTISSVSNLAGDRCSASNLQFGQFFPNNSAVYRLLRKGMRG